MLLVHLVRIRNHEPSVMFHYFFLSVSRQLKLFLKKREVSLKYLERCH